MSRTLPLVIATAASLSFTACQTTQPEEEQDGGRFGHGQTETIKKKNVTTTADDETVTQVKKKSVDSSTTIDTPPVNVEPNPTPIPPPVVQDYPTATPVSGKPGFVNSIGGSGIVDVRGYPPGTEVRDPYSGKVFLVP